MTNPVSYKADKTTLTSLKTDRIIDPSESTDPGSTPAIPTSIPTPVTPTLAVRDRARLVAGANEDRLRQHFQNNWKEPKRDEDGFIVMNPDTWRAAAEKHRPGAEQAIAAVTGGRSDAPIHVGHWSSFDHEGDPIFFQNIPSDANPTGQVYAVFDKATQQWSTHEVAGDIYQAYADPKLTQGRLGSGSWLGYPTSNAAALGVDSPLALQTDPEIKAAVAKGQSVTVQDFEGGYLVNVGGVVRAYDEHGELVGTHDPKRKKNTIM